MGIFRLGKLLRFCFFFVCYCFSFDDLLHWTENESEPTVKERKRYKGALVEVESSELIKKKIVISLCWLKTLIGFFTRFARIHRGGTTTRICAAYNVKFLVLAKHCLSTISINSYGYDSVSVCMSHWWPYTKFESKYKVVIVGIVSIWFDDYFFHFVVFYHAELVFQRIPLTEACW